jgi:cell division protease FtsH
VLAELWALMSERNVYRGRVLELRARHFHEDEGAPLTVRALPAISRDQIVLPEGVLERVERQAFGVADHAERLRASGRHLRRGLLLHGAPGTGKTLTAMYLAAAMPGGPSSCSPARRWRRSARRSISPPRCSRRW